jgi:hypothetical protein
MKLPVIFFSIVAAMIASTILTATQVRVEGPFDSEGAVFDLLIFYRDERAISGNIYMHGQVDTHMDWLYCCADHWF